jgi:hypothetical protein
MNIILYFCFLLSYDAVYSSTRLNRFVTDILIMKTKIKVFTTLKITNCALCFNGYCDVHAVE